MSIPISSLIQAAILFLFALCPLIWALLCPIYYRKYKLLRPNFTIRDIQALYLFEAACLLLAALLTLFR